MKTRHAGALMLSALFCGCAGAAFAQTAPQAGAGGSDTTSLTEVVVTAQHRTERLEDVPISVTALSTGALKSSGITNIHDLGHAVIGAQIEFAGGYTQPAIRGVTTLTVGIGYENNVAVYVDGFYEPDTVTVNTDFANVSEVEVLKGPQGTLYGRNATGGAILINTLDPSKTFTGSVQAGYGNYNDANVEAYISGPVTDKVGFSLAGYDRYSDGYYKALNAKGQDVGNAAPLRQENVRAKLQFTPTSDLKITAGYNYAYVLDAPGLIFHSFQYSPLPNIPGVITPYGPPGNTQATGPFTSTSNVFNSNAASTNEFTLKIDYTTPWGVLTSHTAYALRRGQTTFDYDGTLQNLFIGEFAPGHYADERTFQQALDYNIKAIPNTDLLIGVSYFNDWLNQPDELGIVSGSLSTISNSLLKAHAEAVYFDATYHFTSALSLTVGGRGSFEHKSGKWSEYFFTTPPTPSIDPFTKGADFAAFTPRFALRYEIAPRTNIYASYTQGFRSGAFNVSPTDPSATVPAKPEKITAYEVGFKTASPTYSFDAAGFYYAYHDLQIGLTEPSPACVAATHNAASCPPVNAISNAPAAEVYGVDLEGTVTPVQDLVLRAGVEWLHARYTKFPNAQGNGLDISTMTNVSSQPQDWSGLQMSRAPNFTANGSVDYKIPIAYGKIEITGSGNYTTSYPIQEPTLYGPLAGPALAHKQRYIQPAFGILNASLAWISPDDRYKITAHVNNLTNTRYFITYNGGPFGDYEGFGEPVNYGVEIGYKF